MCFDASIKHISKRNAILIFQLNAVNIDHFSIQFIRNLHRDIWIFTEFFYAIFFYIFQWFLIFIEGTQFPNFLLVIIHFIFFIFIFFSFEFQWQIIVVCTRILIMILYFSSLSWGKKMQFLNLTLKTNILM